MSNKVKECICCWYDLLGFGLHLSRPNEIYMIPYVKLMWIFLCGSTAVTEERKPLYISHE